MLKIKKATPMYTAIFTTKDMYTEDDFDLIQTKVTNTIKEYQKVVAIGSMVKNVKVGDMVWIDPSKYEIKKYTEDSIKADLLTNQTIGYNIKTIEIDGEEYMILNENDVVFVINEYENVIDEYKNVSKAKSDLIIDAKEVNSVANLMNLNK